jgi:predicted nucleic acid-binding protein
VSRYIDSSALIPVYIPEHFSGAARAEILKAGAVPFTAIHRLEITNAFELLDGRKRITKGEHQAVANQLREDLNAQRLVVVDLDLDHVFTEATELSRRHSARLLARSLGLLHVAAAHAIGSRIFVSADDRQLAVARASGLTIIDIKRYARRRRKQGPGI